MPTAINRHCFGNNFCRRCPLALNRIFFSTSSLSIRPSTKAFLKLFSHLPCARVCAETRTRQVWNRGGKIGYFDLHLKGKRFREASCSPPSLQACSLPCQCALPFSYDNYYLIILVGIQLFWPIKVLRSDWQAVLMSFFRLPIIRLTNRNETGEKLFFLIL